MKPALLIMLLAAGAASAAENGRIGVELNKLEPAEGACRAYLVVENAGEALEALSLDLVMFGPDGVISKRLAVEAGPLGADRTSVKAFAIDGVACEAVDRVLLNDVLACAGEAGPREDCRERLDLSSRASAELID